MFLMMFEEKKHRINDASKDVNRPPLAPGHGRSLNLILSHLTFLRQNLESAAEWTPLWAQYLY